MRRIAAVCLLLTLAACRGGSANTPEDVAETLMRALEEGNCKAAKSVVVAPDDLDCAQVGETAGMLDAEGVDLDKVRYKTGKIIDDSTTVTITWGAGLPPEPLDLQRIDSKWRVVFDSAA